MLEAGLLTIAKIGEIEMFMTCQYALLSLVYMISFILVFDRMRYKTKLSEWLSGSNLLNGDELNRIMAIWTACQE